MERRQARLKLAAIGKEAAPALIAVLDSPNRNVRWEAAKALGSVPHPDAARPLVRALEDEDPGVGWLAAEALAAIGESVLPVVLRALIERGDSRRLREGVHHVCRELSGGALADVLEPVLRALDGIDPEGSSRIAAFDAICTLQDRSRR
jgi:hypothetical protein